MERLEDYVRLCSREGTSSGRYRRWIGTIAAAAVIGVSPASAQSVQTAGEQDRAGVLRASIMDGPVSVDGRLDEPVWAGAEAADEFLQFEPREGAPVTQRTEARVLFGPQSLIVGARLFDESPGRIQRTLGRRDEYMQADWFAVSLDAHLDRRTAFLFAVNAAGVEYDALQTEDMSVTTGPGGGGDASWDAIWDSAVRVTAEGWSVEMEIPYSMLRFSRTEVQTWGIHFAREIPRLGEVSEWPLVPRTERANLIAGFGTLEGIKGIDPRRNVQITPYTLTRLDRREGDSGTAVHETAVDVGGDVRIGIGSNVTLNATVNPDFGQVESDPAELNLTAFETFFEERRPFFVEGSQIYQFPLVSRGNLLYTRRIGADNPILGAAKLSGRTEGGLSFGVLAAATGPSFGRVGDGRQYGAVRASQQIGRFSSAGGVVTYFDGIGRRTASGGVDWDLRMADNTYGLRGFTAFTRGTNLETGLTGQVAAGRRKGLWTYEVGADFIDDHFDPNDLGRSRYNNTWGVVARLGHDLHRGQAFGPFQRAELGGYTFHQWSYDEGINLGGRLALDSEWTLLGFQTVAVGVQLDNHFGGYDLFETRGLWANRIPVAVGAEAAFETDDRRRWSLRPEAGVQVESDGGEIYSGGVRANWNVLSRFALEAESTVEWGVGTVEWAANETFRRAAAGWSIQDSNSGFVPFDDQGQLDEVLESVPRLDGGDVMVPIFGARDTRTIDLTVRSSYTFTPDLALQLYSQFFVARARYADYRILTDPDTYEDFEPFPKRYEFSRSSFQFNAVLRWEYRPGSELYVVWTQSRRADDELHPLFHGASPYDRPFSDQFADTFGIFPENVFLIKLNYTFLN